MSDDLIRNAASHPVRQQKIHRNISDCIWFRGCAERIEFATGMNQDQVDRWSELEDQEWERLRIAQRNSQSKS
ncbi:hypothetical protein [Moorena sp. SIO3B2]|uniref:hypothetical protein n=1 Tax=Moorena sp. SIO3B2 TaxID=2607827 RepID=UPI0013C75FCF|nr:hypothetical protein [Moorena sp. SIO3B2]NEP35390.1 hypothetical protein [Moorena sp. SIO3B2]